MMAAGLSALLPTRRAPARSEPPETLDLAHITRPIPGPSPTGVSLRYETEYDRIREARRDEDPALPQGVWQRDLKRADWNRVIAQCVEALAERSKDLQIACWLVEALAHSRGLPGLADGLRALIALCDGFWPQLFPTIDDGDIAARIAPIEWIDDKIPSVLYTLPLTSADTAESPTYSWTDYVNAQRQEMARGGGARVVAPASPAVTLDDFFTAAGATPTGFYETLTWDLGQCLDSVAALKASLDRACGKEGPSLAQLHDALGNLQGFVDALLAQRDDKIAPLQPAPIAEDPVSSGWLDEPAPSPPRLQIRSRDEAYQLLVEIADYLFAVEPHSPTPYIVQRAASWGNMPLSQLLIELTKGNNDLSALFELLGVGRDGEMSRIPGERSKRE
jgi:type VI secretion system ImpA family protein